MFFIFKHVYTHFGSANLHSIASCLIQLVDVVEEVVANFNMIDFFFV